MLPEALAALLRDEIVLHARVLDMLFEQVERLGATLFMVTHDHALLDRFQRVFDVRELSERQAS